jgi:hypothetical protein
MPARPKPITTAKAVANANKRPIPNPICQFFLLTLAAKPGWRKDR